MKAVTNLGKQVMKWDKDCDTRLHRFMSYLHRAQNLQIVAYVGDRIDQCRLALFCDADFAGDHASSKGTSGVFLAVVGPTTFVPRCNVSKKQGYVSTST